MANSLTDWLAKRVLSSSVSSFDSALETQWDSQTRTAATTSPLSTLLDDVAYLRGAKVQITRFFTPQGAREVAEEMHLQEESNGKERETGISQDYLWASVADRIHSVHVRFSPHCVARFDSTHSRELISLRGAVIALTKFRPSVSFIPSALENKRNRRGPFAPPEPILATLFLEVESFEVFGSINEVIFWDSKELQYTLLHHSGSSSKSNDDTAASVTVADRAARKAFQSWFRQVEKVLIKEQRAKSRLKDTQGQSVGAPAVASQASLGNVHNNSTSSGNTSGGSLSTSYNRLPPPYQKPAQPAKHPASLESASNEVVPSREDEKKQHQQKKLQEWGDFQLSQMGFDEEEDGDGGAGADDFGLEAAASQMLDNIASSSAAPTRSTQSQAVATREDHSFDPFSLSLSLTDNEMNFATGDDMDQDVIMTSLDAPSKNATSNSSSSSLPPTYPVIVQDAAAEERHASLPVQLRPEENASLPTDGGDKETPEIDAASKQQQQLSLPATADGSGEGEEEDMFKLAVEADSYVEEDGTRGRKEDDATGNKTTAMTTELERRSLLPPSEERTRVLRVEQVTMTSPEPSSGSSTHSATSSSSKARRWNNVIRRPTPEEMRERERTYASRIDLIVD